MAGLELPLTDEAFAEALPGADAVFLQRGKNLLKGFPLRKGEGHHLALLRLAGGLRRTAGLCGI